MKKIIAGILLLVCLGCSKGINVDPIDHRKNGSTKVKCLQAYYENNNTGTYIPLGKFCKAK